MFLAWCVGLLAQNGVVCGHTVQQFDPCVNLCLAIWHKSCKNICIKDVSRKMGALDQDKDRLKYLQSRLSRFKPPDNPFVEEAKLEEERKRKERDHARPGRSSKQGRIHRKKLNQAVAAGQIVKEPCADCGTWENLEFHHTDYTPGAWYTGQWLCRSCHEVHTKQAQRAAWARRKKEEYDAKMKGLLHGKK
jgi:hypothetical protein